MIRLLRKVAFWEATFFVVLCLAWVVTLTGYKFTGGWQTALVVVGLHPRLRVHRLPVPGAAGPSPDALAAVHDRSASWWPA